MISDAKHFIGAPLEPLRANRAALWLPIVPLTTAALLTMAIFLPWGAWLLVTVALWGGLKWLAWQIALVDLWSTMAESLTSGRIAAARRRFWLWPGMDAEPFLRGPSDATPRPSMKQWGVGAANTAVGAALVWGGARLVPEEYPWAQSWTFLVGLGLFIHCGLVHLESLAWRRFGIDAEPVMNRPLRAASLADFWGRRWNTPFRDLGHRVVFRPVTRRFGPRAGIAAVFVFSGVIHDVAISIPSRGGWGLPTAYFILQALAQSFQRGPAARRWGLARGWGGRLLTAAVVVGPVALLFHPPFMAEVIQPLMEIVGAK